MGDVMLMDIKCRVKGRKMRCVVVGREFFKIIVLGIMERNVLHVFLFPATSISIHRYLIFLVRVWVKNGNFLKGEK